MTAACKRCGARLGSTAQSEHVRACIALRRPQALAEVTRNLKAAVRAGRFVTLEDADDETRLAWARHHAELERIAQELEEMRSGAGLRAPTDDEQAAYLAALRASRASR